MTKLAFVDTETTGLDPDLHEIWEVGLILRDEDGDTEYHWFLPVDLGRADAFALNIGHFHERWQSSKLGKSFMESATHLTKFAPKFAQLTRGCHLVGNVISFDEERLRKLLRYNGACPEWHYHLIDVEALAVGYLAGVGHNHDGAGEKSCHTPPWKSDDLTVALGVPAPSDEVRHTAMGDARVVRDMYDAIMGKPSA